MVVNNRNSSLRLVLLRLLGVHLFIPLAILCLLTVAGVAYLGEQNLKLQQHQLVNSIAKSVNDHLDNSGRILEAIARLAEVSSKDELSAYMKSTWEAYGYFDTLYYLDEENYCVIGQKFGNKYKLGDKVRISVKSANVEKRQLDFKFAEEEIA